jgi:outer membrane protein TolC
VTRDHLKLISQMISVVRVKYEVGKVGQHQLLRLQLLESKLVEELRSFARDDRALTATINASLRRPLAREVQTPKRLEPTAPRWRVAQLLQRAKEQRPLLRLHRARARTERQAAKRAAREGYPDFTAWIGYRVRIESGSGADPGTDFFSAGLSIPLPLFYERKHGSRRQRHEAQALASEQQGKGLLLQIRASLGRELATWRRAVQEAEAHRRRLIPLARRALDATLAAYQVGRADFASLFQAELQLLELARAIRRAEAAAALSRAEVEALVGTRLNTSGGG